MAASGTEPASSLSYFTSDYDLHENLQTSYSIFAPTIHILASKSSSIGQQLNAMARPRKVKKGSSQKQSRDTTAVVITDATAFTDRVATLDRPFVPPRLIRDERSSIDISSGNVQTPGFDDTKPQSQSMSMTELDAMARKQLLASLNSTIPSPKIVRVSVSSKSTRGPESRPSGGLRKVSPSRVATWSISMGSAMLLALLVTFLLSTATERILPLIDDFRMSKGYLRGRDRFAVSQISRLKQPR